MKTRGLKIRRRSHTAETGGSRVPAARSEHPRAPLTGAPPPARPRSLRPPMDTEVGRLRVGTLERPGRLSPGAHGLMERTRRQTTQVGKRGAAGWPPLGRRGEGRRSALEGRSWRRVQQQRACELGDWRRAGPALREPAGPRTGLEVRPGRPARLLNGGGRARQRLLSRPRGGTWGFGTKGSSSPLSSRTASRSTAPAGSHPEPRRSAEAWCGAGRVGSGVGNGAAPGTLLQAEGAWVQGRRAWGGVQDAPGG